MQIDTKLISYSTKNLSGYTIELKQGHISKVKPSNKKRFCVANKTLIEVYKHKNKIYFDNLILLRKNKVYLGGYYNKQKGCIQIETVELFADRNLAIAEGNHWKQISIYDLIKCQEIPLRKVYT